SPHLTAPSSSMYAGQSRNIMLACIASSPSCSAAQPAGPSGGDLHWLRPGLVYEVEWCPAGPAETGQARPGDHIPDPGLTGLGAERQPDLLRPRRARAQPGRESRAGPPQRVEVVLPPVT